MNKRTLAIAFAVLGFLLTCCLCPLTVNYLAIFNSRQTSFYDTYLAFPVENWTITFQLVCSSVLALVVLILGLVALLQARNNGKPQPPA